MFFPRKTLIAVALLLAALSLSSRTVAQTALAGPQPAKSHVGPELQALVQNRRAAAARGVAFRNENPLLVFHPTADKVLVRVTADNIPALLPSLLALGFEVTGYAPELFLVEGFLPVEALSGAETLGVTGSLGGVLAVPRPAAGVGLVTSQGDFIHETNRVRAARPTGYDGSGVRIGVMSDSYNLLGGAATDSANNDLPPAASIILLQEGPAGSADEGRAMMQIAHDLAPGSPLAFSSVFTGEVNFAAQIRALARTAGCQVLTDDIFYFAEPMFQDGVIAQAINDVVTTDGVAYFALAGNLGSNGWETTTVQTFTFSGTTGTFLDFDPSAAVNTRQRLSLTNGQRVIITVQWDNPFYTASGVKTDIDAFLYQTGTSTVVASSTADNIANKTPSETFSYTNTSGATQTYDLSFQLYAGPVPTRFKWVNYGANSFGAVTVLDFPKTTPTIIPHSAAINGRSVGAVNFYDQLTPASFTSLGPSTLLFEANGTRKAAVEIRQTPQMGAIQGVDTTFFGSDFDGNGFKNFFGTSAAAPTAAAIGALVRQANPAFTPAQIYSAMQTTAADIGAAGFDNLSGSGLVNAWRAIFGVPAPAALPFNTGFETGGLTLPWEIRDTGAGRLLVTAANAPAAGSFHLTMDSSLNNQSSLNEAVLHLDASGSQPVYLIFTEREFNDSDNVMPATFTGSSNSDGVALSVNGANWVRVADLTGANSTNANQNFQINLSDAAAANGLTLGADTRVKFQHFGSLAIASAGMAFDAVQVFRNAPAAAVFTNGALPAATVGVPYSFTFTASGNPPPTFRLSAGALPPGLSLNAATGVVSGTPTAPGVFTGLQAAAASGFGAEGTQNFSLTVGNSLANYLAGFDLTGSKAAPTEDPNADGFNNLLEYALNQNPTAPKTNPGALLDVQVRPYAGGNYLSIRFTRVPLAQDLTYEVQVSPDLTNWTTVAASSGGAALTGPGFVADAGGNSPLTVEARDTVAQNSAAPNQKRFLRLRVTQP